MASTNYLTSDKSFQNCLLVVTTLLLMNVTKLCLDGITIGVMYCRIQRPTKRASTVLFSDKAIIRREYDRLFLMFQVCELRKHQICDTKVRLYAVQREYDVHGNVHAFQTSSMKIYQPENGQLVLFLPAAVIHEINQTSPLNPPELSRASSGKQGSRRKSYEDHEKVNLLNLDESLSHKYIYMYQSHLQ